MLRHNDSRSSCELKPWHAELLMHITGEAHPLVMAFKTASCHILVTTRRLAYRLWCLSYCLRRVQRSRASLDAGRDSCSRSASPRSECRPSSSRTRPHRLVETELHWSCETMPWKQTRCLCKYTSPVPLHFFRFRGILPLSLWLLHSSLPAPEGHELAMHNLSAWLI